MAGDPLFSVVITTYNRLGIVERCVESCLAQSWEDFEIVVVDDASTDATAEELGARYGERLRVIRHDVNRGINPSRHTGAAAARGAWIVMLDSDWELLPHSLSRLSEIIAGRPEGVTVIRSQLLWDNGGVTPSCMPEGILTYEDRISWVESGGGLDAGRCIHRSALERAPYISDRKGAMERLHELRLAKVARTLWVAEVLGRQHTDAPHSYMRSVDRRDYVPRTLKEAPDMLWMAETVVAEHGAALRRLGPSQLREVHRTAAMQAFLAGQRRRGLRHSWRWLRSGRPDLTSVAIILLGLVDRRCLVEAALLARKRLHARQTPGVPEPRAATGRPAPSPALPRESPGPTSSSDAERPRCKRPAPKR